ncbi:hypothetical protein ACFL6Y_03165 [Elusimicrobiota bacterium]
MTQNSRKDSNKVTLVKASVLLLIAAVSWLAPQAARAELPFACAGGPPPNSMPVGENKWVEVRDGQGLVWDGGAFGCFDGVAPEIISEQDAHNMMDSNSKPTLKGTVTGKAAADLTNKDANGNGICSSNLCTIEPIDNQDQALTKDNAAALEMSPMNMEPASLATQTDVTSDDAGASERTMPARLAENNPVLPKQQAPLETDPQAQESVARMDQITDESLAAMSQADLTRVMDDVSSTLATRTLSSSDRGKLTALREQAQYQFAKLLSRDVMDHAQDEDEDYASGFRIPKPRKPEPRVTAVFLNDGTKDDLLSMTALAEECEEREYQNPDMRHLCGQIAAGESNSVLEIVRSEHASLR